MSKGRGWNGERVVKYHRKRCGKSEEAHVLRGDWEDKRMKALRYGLIRIAGRVIEHARRLVIRVSGEHPAYRLLLEARERIAEPALPGG